MRYLLYLFYLEILINLVTIGQGLFTPSQFVLQFANTAVSALLAVARLICLWQPQAVGIGE